MKKLMFVAAVALSCAAFAEESKPVAVYTMPKLSAEQKATIAEKRKEWESKTPEERAAIIKERKTASDERLLARFAAEQKREENKVESIAFDYAKGEITVTFIGGEKKTIAFAK